MFRKVDQMRFEQVIGPPLSYRSNVLKYLISLFFMLSFMVQEDCILRNIMTSRQGENREDTQIKKIHTSKPL